jgi:transcriptional regulator
MPSPSPVLPGTLEFLILQSLRTGEHHGLGVARRVEQITRGAFAVKAGSLFPALHRMERAGWVTSSWGESDNRRRARFYRLTARGRRQLQTEATEWRRVIGALTAALGASHES